MLFTVHLNQLIDESTPLEQSTIETYYYYYYYYYYSLFTPIAKVMASKAKLAYKKSTSSRKLRKFPVTSGQLTEVRSIDRS